jgi:hypothetical protein
LPFAYLEQDSPTAAFAWNSEAHEADILLPGLAARFCESCHKL